MESFFDPKIYKISFKKYLDETEYGNHLEIFDAKIEIIKSNNEKEIVAETQFIVFDNYKTFNDCGAVRYQNLFFDADNFSSDSRDNCEDLFKKRIDVDDVRKWIHIYTFEVKENYRSKKIGTNFFKEILKKVKYREKLDVISLTPSSLTETKDFKSYQILKEKKIAREFWKSCGFSKFRRTTYVYNVEQLKKNNILWEI